MATLISHFYNEEYLLPWWLQHHLRLFEHGILINNGSTDRSVEIIRSLAPHWEIVDSPSGSVFHTPQVEQEVMAIEERVQGWKVVLNITEFFCCYKMDLDEMIRDFEAQGSGMYKLEGIIMADPPAFAYQEPDYNLPLVLQRYHGCFFEECPYGTVGHRLRFMHKHPNGWYTPGRHTSAHPRIEYPLEKAFLLWYGWSPWNENLRKRRLQIGPTMTCRGHGGGHGWSAGQMDMVYSILSNVTTDLRTRPEFQKMYESWTF
ncbi:glycosyltransferase family 2 protein [Baia soyae]|uniref:Glycosyl transferase family 2 n=1 Tax=Baia soyae TaxID=1544746 RepID=A0A4R2S1R4_9BACL|nr:glycosyltransferase family 2 protein [Baia soyae]TCP70103.1 glycosyl transferase family 2 [Baia soyae]